MIPDFGGFLVKANSEGQPGPGDFGRTHADGANMLADALAAASSQKATAKGPQPEIGIVMWRCFVYGANHKGEDRVKQAVSEFKPLDGQFRPNVILQTKNGPLDFQPREPYSPIFDQIKQTPNMVELQITQEYLGQSRHLVYLAPMWKEFFSFVAPPSTNNSPSSLLPPPSTLKGIAGVANIGLDRNWCGHHFSQANWYAFGRPVEAHHNLWHTKLRHFIDEQRWREVDERMQHQVENAREWRDVCLKYFGQFAEASH